MHRIKYDASTTDGAITDGDGIGVATGIGIGTEAAVKDGNKNKLSAMKMIGLGQNGPMKLGWPFNGRNVGT
jgi:hypothetical protein